MKPTQSMTVLLREDDKSVIAEPLMIADTFGARLRGLIGRDLGRDAGLWITPCRGIHTFGMGYCIDVIFVDSRLRIAGLAPSIPKWRVRPSPRNTRSTIELAAGRIDQLNLRKNDQLVVINQTSSEINP